MLLAQTSDTQQNEVIPQFIPVWGKEENDAVQRVMNSDYLNEHKTVREFEKRFAEFVGSKYCVTCMNGTTALYMAVLSVKERLDKIRIPDYYSIFLHNSCVQAGLDMTISPVESNGCMKPETQSDIVVNTNGRTLGTTLIEDNSQCVSYHSANCVSTYSFASTKHLTLGGQGGAICCDDKEIFDRLSKLKDLGRNDRQQLKPMSDKFEEWGFNSKVTELQAAFGLAQLGRVPTRLNRLKTMASMYKDMLSKCKEVEFFDDDAKWHLDIRVPDPQKVIDRMKKNKIHCKRYMTPLHMQPVASALTHDGDLHMTKYLFEHGLYLPSTTTITDKQMHRIGERLVDAIRTV